jgi:hypothetical protein
VGAGIERSRVVVTCRESRRGDTECDEMKSSCRRPYVGRSVKKKVCGNRVLYPDDVVVGSTRD